MQIEAIEWRDTYSNRKERKIYTDREHGIPGLRMIGYEQITRATAPLPVHYHRGCFELTYVVRGNVEFHVETERWQLSGGDAFLTQPDERHDTGDSPMSPHTMYWLQLDPGDPTQFLNLREETARLLISQLKQLKERTVSMDRRTENLLREAFEGVSCGTELGRLHAANLLGVLLSLLVKKAGGAETKKQAPTGDISGAVAYIWAHLQEPVSLERLADLTGLSVSGFQKKFKKQMGSAPRDYINFQKIERAKQLLRQQMAVTEVAMALGFSSSDYFSVVFRRYTSTTPTAYARR